MTRRHIVLVSYGEPATPSFLAQFAYSWRILQNLTRIIAAIPTPLIPVIALSRAHGRRALWREKGYGSPLESITQAQASRVREALEGMDSSAAWEAHVAYEFRRPSLHRVIQALPKDEPVWVAPMYAADSAFTHALSRAVASAVTARGERRASVVVLPAIDPDRLAALSARHVLASLEADAERRHSMALVLAAHGTLLEPSKPIDTGLAGTQRLCDAIRTPLVPMFGTVTNGWLNHARGGRWTEPPIDRTLQAVDLAGFSKVVYFPYGFLADNAESQLEGRVIAEAYPRLDIRFLPCLNESRGLANEIATQVMTTLGATGT